MIDFETAAKLGAPLVTLIIGALIKYYATGRPKLITYIGHISSFNVPGDSPLVLNMHSVIVRNTGNRPARNVRLSHYYLPQHLSVDPPTQYSVHPGDRGSGDILIPVLVPREQVTVSYLYFPPVTWNQIHSATKSDEGLAKIITAIPTPQPSRLVVASLWALVFVGASVLVYWLVRAIAFAI
jgi:hypothetical protein